MAALYRFVRRSTRVQGPHLRQEEDIRCYGRGMVTIVLTVLVACQPAPKESKAPESPAVDSPTTPATPPNIVLILTDDQRWDTLWAMPTLLAHSQQDTNFLTTRVTTPMCCPVRASIWSGGYLPAEVGVISNDPPNGGFTAFDVANTLAERMQQAGYHTAYYGKYMNGAGDLGPATLPLGWDEVAWTTEDSDYSQWGFWTGKGGEAPVRVDESGYVTDALVTRQQAFIDQQEVGKPFFLVLAPMAPHGPVEPAPQDAGSFADYTYRDRAWAEADMSDKPTWIQENADPLEGASHYDDMIRKQLGSLLAVDRLVKAVDDALVARNLDDSTVRFYSSDNGYLWEEHRLWGKGVAYEESVRVPLVVWGGGFPKGQSDAIVAMNLDVPATIQALVGLSPSTEGLDLRDVVRRKATRRSLLLAGFGFDQPSWVGIVDERWKLIQSITGEVEVYDLLNDPYELDGREDAGAPVGALSATLESNRPLMLKNQSLADGQLNVPYDLLLESWGGKSPVRYQVTGLPKGLAMVRDHIQGVPLESGSFPVSVLVRDSSHSAVTGRSQSFSRGFLLNIGEVAQLRSAKGGSSLSLHFDHPVRLRVRLSPDPQMDRLAFWWGPEKGSDFEVPLPKDWHPCYARLEVNGAPGPRLSRRVDESY